MSLKDRKFVGYLYEVLGDDVTVAGWVSSVRNQKRMQFLNIRDHTGEAQAVNERKGDYLDERIADLKPESTVIASGKVVDNPNVKLGKLELVLNSLDVLSTPEGPIPIDSNSSQEARLDWRFLDLRDPKKQLIFKIQTTAESAMRNYWLMHGFIEIHSPKLVGGATESGSELFQLNYFGKTASLAQSPQFYKQMAMASGFDRVFEIGPVFRANPSYTRRHDTEFTSVDTEMSWIDSHEDVMQFEENWLQFVLNEVSRRYGREIADNFGTVINVPKTPFPRIPINQAYAIIRNMGHEVDRGAKGDLDPEGEKLLSRYVKENFDHDFVFVTDYPASARPFYHMRYPDSDKTKSFDLLWKGLEVTTGAQREHRYNKLYAQAKEKGVDTEAIGNYLDFFKYGCPPHGGFGFGLTRMLMTALDAQNVREVTFVYRGPNRLKP